MFSAASKKTSENQAAILTQPRPGTMLIRQGIVVDHQQAQKADILIVDGKIADIAPEIHIIPKQCEIIEAAGLYVMPGGIDVHTHFNIDVGIARSCDDFFSGTRAAACGGTTTVVDHMGFGPKGCSLHHQLNVYQKYAKETAVIDYSFHGVIQHVNEDILAEMASMVEEEGISSFKLYLTYGYKLDDEDVLKALIQLKQVGALATVHPENDAAIALRRSQLLEQGKTAPKYHAVSRPLECEAEAIARMINLAKLAGDAPLYIVHLSNGLGLDYARLARDNHQPVWVETCPQYLMLDDSCYEREDALKYILSPPLRPAAEREKLWLGLVDGSIDTVATDHCAFTYHDQKQRGKDNFSACPNGMPGVETRMPLLFSEGVMKGRLSPSRFVELTSYLPAKLFGLYPQKGALQAGSDADLVLFDPEQEVSIKHELLHDNADYTPFEDIQTQGWPVMTISRGDVVACNGEFTGKAGNGRFIRRKPFDASAL
ncbi:phenylhydantoinase [Photobacterium gaetbulicola Gung47]|uniref:Phenylhydantoinase n=1 Tax=Photobacterium gaetbulicola Gung47 TaxID=658445 RepID=A0A0C5WC08_9GAMM|nr:dihydropyrimidinase [Photobacterium gaetbulicola]AJR09176.1 phenylhydantoinase [Photobacterium gaetbulicola Gung47]